MYYSLSREASTLVKKRPMANYWTTAAVLTGLALLALGCGLSSGNVREEGMTIPPTQTEPNLDLGLGAGARPLSFGPGDKGSPRISPSGEKVAFVLDGSVVEKDLYTQDLRSRTATSDIDALSTEWLSNESLAILGPKDEARDGNVQAVPGPGSLLVAYKDGSLSDDASNVRRLPEKVDAVGAAPGSQLVATAVSASPTAESLEEPASRRLMLLGGSGDPAKVYLGGIEGLVTGLSVSPDGRGVALAVRSDADNESRRKDRFEVQVYRFSEGQARRVASIPEGMEILGAPQWTQEEIYFVAGKVDDTAASSDDPAPPYFLYRVPEDSEPENSNSPEPVRSVGEGFVATSINVSPDGSRLAVVGRRNPGSPTNLYILDLTSEALEAATTNDNMEIKTNPRDLAWSPDGQSVILVARSALSGPEVYDAQAETLSSAFYNLYEVPIRNGFTGGGG
jgi:TolB protein